MSIKVSNVGDDVSKEVAEVEPAYILNHSLDCEMAKPPRTYESLNNDGSTGVGVIIPMCTCYGQKTPLFTYSPTAHQAAASMKQKCLDECNKLVKGFHQAGSSDVGAHECLKAIQAIPTVEESK
jgi:hypothetical protein